MAQDTGFKDRIEYEALPLGSGVWTAIHKAINITSGAFERRDADNSHLESPNNVDEKVPAGAAVQDYSFSARYDHTDASHGQCFADNTAGTDANIVPGTLHDFAITPDGSDITAQIAAAGFYRAS